jgi:hypothetical protein
MQKVSMNIGEVVKGMDVAMNAMDLEKVHTHTHTLSLSLSPSRADV